jgi:hypothetical protein
MGIKGYHEKWELAEQLVNCGLIQTPSLKTSSAGIPVAAPARIPATRRSNSASQAIPASGSLSPSGSKD